MDFGSIVTQAASLVGMQPSTLLFWIFVVNTGARITARRIPDNAVGFWGGVRQLCAILGAEVATKLTSDVSSKDVLKAAAQTPAVANRIEAANAADDKSQ